MFAPHSSDTFQLPFNVAPQVVIGERFHIKPTLPRLALDGRFYILARSRERLRLFECDPERRLTMHTTEKQGDRVPSGDPAVFRVHGAGPDNQEAILCR